MTPITRRTAFISVLLMPITGWWHSAARAGDPIRPGSPQRTIGRAPSQETAAPCQNSDQKMDDGIVADDAFRPIFVRMQDQLFKQAGDFEAFCRENDSERRTVTRRRVQQTLHEKADRSWELIRDRVAGLESSGQLRQVTRFWIVNGFACDATGNACKALSEDPNVSFVYLQRGPDQVRQHRAVADANTDGGDLKAVDDLPEAQRAQVLARLKEQGVDPSTVRVRLGNAMSLPDAATQRAALEQLLSELRSDADEPFRTDGLEVPWNLKAIQADQVWEREGIVGKGVVVAINDVGVVDIPSLRPALWRNPAEELNGKDDDGNGYVDDLFGYNFAFQTGYILDSGAVNHGSMCAGIVAGRPLPDKPLVTGVAPRARIMALNGMGYLKAYEYALQNGADIVSMSYMWVNMELGNYRGLFRTGAEHLTAAGVFIAGGAGNFSKTAPPGKQICSPKDIPCVVAVSGIGENGDRMEFSSQGPCTWSGVRFYDDYPEAAPLRKPDLTAPASGFPCWTKSQSSPQGRNWRVLWGDDTGSLVIGPAGNSFAGPHAAGVAALMLSANPDLNAWQVKQIMEQTAKDLGDPGPDNQFGAGLIQALEAVRVAKKRVK
jgi:subtilisin family serine protease